MKQLGGWTVLLSTRLSTWKQPISQKNNWYEFSLLPKKKKFFFTWNDKIELTAQGYWRFYSKLDKGLVLVLLQVADEDREIYDPGYYCKPLGPIFPHIHLVFRYIPW